VTSSDEQPTEPLSALAARVAIATLVVLGILAVMATLWLGRVILALLFLAIVIASAIRPSVEALRRKGIPKGFGVLLHYAALAGLLALGLWLAVPAAIDQVQGALGLEQRPSAGGAESATGVKHDVLIALDHKLRDLPSGTALLDPAFQYGRKAFEVFIGMFFVVAAAAYWIIERERAIDVVCSLLPGPKRKVVRDTWELVDLRLGAFVRGQALLIAVVATILSAGFWATGLPYWLLVGVFAGVVEIVPVIGPLVAGITAIGVASPSPRTSR